MAFLNDSMVTRKSTSLWQAQTSEALEETSNEEVPCSSKKSTTNVKEIIALKKEELSIKRRYVEQQDQKKSASQVFGESVAMELENLPAPLFRKLKIRIMTVINEEITEYENSNL
ncbi:PREDICTED: uncharacterized protein LOC108355166 [Rhagoletis zephyria]|uniref:uncharacterized protein LOC108355166 n=1 Tax=Rhagoletis zephyria TaxID=28612 RepID=UPI000811292E|nr:PREDICTED: uncharacterized protein LOC108355166 [Rhagoletis zephyria]